MNKFEQILPYITIFQNEGGNYIIWVNFSDKWTVTSNNDGKIKAVWNRDMKSWVYQARQEDVKFDDLCDYIQYTIDINKEAEAKCKLFEAKKQELHELFQNKSLRELEGLDFIVANVPEDSKKIITPPMACVNKGAVEEKPAIKKGKEK